MPAETIEAETGRMPEIGEVAHGAGKAALAIEYGDVRSEFPGVHPLTANQTTDHSLSQAIKSEIQEPSGFEKLKVTIADLKHVNEISLATLDSGKWEYAKSLNSRLSELADGIGGSFHSGEFSRAETVDAIEGLLEIMDAYQVDHRQRAQGRALLGVYGFGGSAEKLFGLFKDIGFGEERHEFPTWNREVPFDQFREMRFARMLMPFASNTQYDLHKQFVGKFKWKIDDRIDLEHYPDMAALVKMPEFLAMMGDRTAEHYKTYGNNLNSWPEEEANAFLSCYIHFGLDRPAMYSCKRALETYKEPQDRALAAQEGFETMARLMSINPGLPAKIHDPQLFGIRHFNRYDAETLHQQYQDFAPPQERLNTKPNVLVVSATSDWNGSLSKTERKWAAIPGVIFMEASNLDELLHRVMLTRRSRGRLNALVVAGHGNEQGIRLSDKSFVTKDEVQNYKNLPRLAPRIFTQHAEVILASCSTGAKNGFAEALSQITDMKIFASKKVTSGGVSRQKEGLHKLNFPNRETYEYLKENQAGFLKLMKQRANELLSTGQNAGVVIEGGKRRPLKAALNLAD